MPRSLGLRLASMFGLISFALLGAIGSYLLASLEHEIALRDDLALEGRLERMRALIGDSESIDELRKRRQLYENMLGNRDSLLWVLDTEGHPLIAINPTQQPIPQLPAEAGVHLRDVTQPSRARIALQRIAHDGGSITLVAGQLLAGREQMLHVYRNRLWVAMAVGGALSFLFGWGVSLRGLRPVRALAKDAALIDAQHLSARLQGFDQVAELQQLSESLNTMLARLEDGFGRISRFSEDLAHEMRTPLSNLMGETQLALTMPRSVDSYQALLTSNQEEYERLSRMVDNILFLARASQPGAAVHLEAVPLEDAIGQLCEYFEGLAAERGNSFGTRVAGTVLADSDLLRRALANLLVNAMKYGAPDSPIHISSHGTAAGVEIRVANTGPEIGAAHMPYLFDRFYRVDSARTASAESSGLGLAIVRSIMALHGGQLLAKSDRHETVFTLVFPARADA
ncbi:heavy metal sensor histidine kinase [Variovorax sp. PAMC 28711]|uniref:heavy metal sensor histidine kinase n=1 Tax=Variovorax sp. PAMC 28711 TaxID=1795631 RepID=UPI000A45787C|nr:heavy metal sensor histidine kinase [Variovorax sp. PAMC 28711]